MAHLPRPLRYALPAIAILISAVRLQAQAGSLLDGAFTILLDSATIAASPARTLADLLAGRVAGLNVTYPTGAPGYAPELTARGTATMYGTGRPLLYVDGVQFREDRHLLGPSLDRQRPSHMWSLPTEEIAEVRVLLGPAAGTLLPFGTPRGAVLVRTKRGGRSAWRSRAFLETALQPVVAPFRTRVTTRGDVIGGGTTDFCPRTDQATGYCIASGTSTFLPFGGESPMRSSMAMRGGLSAAGDAHIATVRLGADFDQAPTLAVSNDWLERLELSVAAESHEWHGLTASASARYERSAGEYARWTQNGLMQLGASAVQPTDPIFPLAYRVADSILARALPYRTDRTGGSVALRYVPRPGLLAWLDLSTERVTRGSHASEAIVTDSAGASIVIGRTSEGNDYRHGSGSATLGVRARRALPHGVRLTGEIAGTLTNVDLVETAYDFGEIFGGGSSGSTQSVTPDLRSRTFVIDARLDMGANAWVGGGFRKEATRLFGPTFGDDPFNTFQGGWTISRAPFFPRVRGVDRVHLRGAYGEGGDHEAVIDVVRLFAFTPGPGTGTLPARLQRTLEREAGADVDLLGGRVLVRATAFARALRDGYLNTNLGAPGGSPVAFGSWQTHGSEWSVTVPSRGDGPWRWDAALTWSSARTRMTKMWGVPPVTTTLFGLSRVKFGEGLPFGAVYAFGYTYADANLDGIIDASEITITPETMRGVTQPTDLLGATLTVRWRDHLSAGVTLDGKYGHVRYDGTQRLTCQLLVCDDLYRTNASLAAQARAVASGYTGTFTGPVEPGAFVRARDLWVRVALPGTLGLRDAALTLAVRNAVAWDRAGHGDPETGSFAFATVQRGDYYTPGLARQFSLRLDIAP